MRRSLVASASALILAFSAHTASAQQCPAGLAQDGCEQARDFFLYMAPQLGTSLTGGSHTLGIGTNLGGFPHFAIALRVNGVMGDLPQLENVSLGGAVSKNIETQSQYLGLPTVDFALGITKGFNVGVTRIGGIDLIGGATYVPEFTGDDVTLTPQGGSLSIGLGARVGLLQQSALIPGVAFSYLKRDLPTLDFLATTDGGDEFNINDFAVKTNSWRLSAQKNFLLFQFGAGVGQDIYKFSTVASGTVTQEPITETFGFSANESLSRNTMYGSLGINLLLIKIVGEVGQVSGGTVETFNTFTEPADKTRMYGTLGVRISF